MKFVLFRVKHFVCQKNFIKVFLYLHHDICCIIAVYKSIFIKKSKNTHRRYDGNKFSRVAEVPPPLNLEYCLEKPTQTTRTMNPACILICIIRFFDYRIKSTVIVLNQGLTQQNNKINNTWKEFECNLFYCVFSYTITVEGHLDTSSYPLLIYYKM